MKINKQNCNLSCLQCVTTAINVPLTDYPLFTTTIQSSSNTNGSPCWLWHVYHTAAKIDICCIYEHHHYVPCCLYTHIIAIFFTTGL